jgi:hypothetical protein
VSYQAYAVAASTLLVLIGRNAWLASWTCGQPTAYSAQPEQQIAYRTGLVELTLGGRLPHLSSDALYSPYSLTKESYPAKSCASRKTLPRLTEKRTIDILLDVGIRMRSALIWRQGRRSRRAVMEANGRHP